MADMCCAAPAAGAMGLAPDGRMRQEIYEDPYSIHDWDADHRSRCFIHLVHSITWRQIIGEQPPSKPLTDQDYTSKGFPWFDYYDADAKALEGTETLSGIKSVATLAKEKRDTPLPDNESISIPSLVKLRAGLKKDQVREEQFD